ncbi:hypothetical protein GCM10027589_27050 [Actinocorallia lasiicapitis]
MYSQEFIAGMLARTLLLRLEVRGLHVSPRRRDRILTCTDLGPLRVWLDRAGSALTLADVFHDDRATRPLPHRYAA